MSVTNKGSRRDAKDSAENPIKKVHNAWTNMDVEDFDDLLEIAGSRGRYQKIFLYGILGPITALMPFFGLNFLFLLSDQDHWCHVPQNDTSFSLEMWKNMTLPLEVGPNGKERLSQCSMYASYDDEGNRSIVSCQYGWDYDQTNYESTIPSTYNWVCEKEHYSTTAFTVQLLGNLAGALVFGNLADRLGRKIVLFMTVLMDATFRISSLFVTFNFPLYLACLFLYSSAFPLLCLTPTLIASEISGKEYRSWIFSFSWVIWVLGMASLPLVAYLARTWLVIGLITSIPCTFILLFYPVLPESPRWLLSSGRIQEAAKIMENVAKKNGNAKKFKPGQLESSLEYLYRKEKEKGENVRVWSLFSKPRLAKNTLMLSLSWSVNKLVYYGITLNSSNIAGNEFLIFFILAIIEIPSGALGGVFVEKIGRRWTSIVFFLVCAVACFGAATAGPGNYTIAFMMIAKFAINLTFLVVYMQGAEIFPTSLRSTGSSFASLIATSASTIGPYMIYIGKVNVSLPYVAMGTLSIIGLLATSWIPETRNRKLPDTLAEANDFGKDDKYFSFRPEADEKDRVKKIKVAPCNTSA